MKKDIHPKYNETTVTCACGHVFSIGSTEKDIKTELCSVCHPFYTGKQKLVDTARRVEKFENKRVAKVGTTKTAAEKKAKEAARKTAKAAKLAK